MKIVIRVTDQDRARAWGFLVRHSAGTALPNNTFIVSDLAVVGLRNAGIDFTEISREGELVAAAGAPKSERI
jgi:hypothetical protein